MLSRVAERVYWLARYVERVENTARLARVQSQLMFDLPKAAKLSWFTLIEITSNEEYFEANYDAKTEKNCMAMLLSDRDNCNSLMSSLWMARENTRTTRDILPREAWLHINELYLYVKENQADFLTRSKRNQLLEKIIRSCQAWSGMLSSTMSQNTTYRFIKLGMSIERADMTTRILDVGGMFVAKGDSPDDEYQMHGILWANLLKSASGYFMYRQHVQTEINGQHVVDFLIHDHEFARSIHFCVNVMRRMTEKLPGGEDLSAAIDRFLIRLDDGERYDVGSTALHDYLDKLQLDFSTLHNMCYQVWFNPKAVA